MSTRARIIECVPNVSEGRDPRILDAFMTAVRTVQQASLLDLHTDWDHHRAVLTLAGTPEGIAEAAFQVARVAVEWIDLRKHRGQHPRIGAADVIPFVPILGASMEEAVRCAKMVGSRIGQALEIPVFLYEEAATGPHRRNLAWIRRGGLEGLAERMGTDSSWKPDFGPSTVHPTAGATVVGARLPLIAFNVNLRATSLQVAKEIARKVRDSSGGLPALKAIGVELRSRGVVQVSMNLTNLEEISLEDAFDAVKGEAERRRVVIEGSEIIGLVPRHALHDDSEARLQLKGFDPGQVLEARLAELWSEDAGRE